MCRDGGHLVKPKSRKRGPLVQMAGSWFASQLAPRCGLSVPEKRTSSSELEKNGFPHLAAQWPSQRNAWLTYQDSTAGRAPFLLASSFKCDLLVAFSTASSELTGWLTD